MELHHINTIMHFKLIDDIHLIPQRTGGLFGVDYSSVCGRILLTTGVV